MIYTVFAISVCMGSIIQYYLVNCCLVKHICWSVKKIC